MRRAVTIKKIWTYLSDAAPTVTGCAARTFRLAAPKVSYLSRIGSLVTQFLGFNCVDNFKNGGPSCVNATLPTNITTETDAT
jgi:hypothetical protein